MNFYTKSLYRHRPAMAKILLVMRLIVVLLTTAILQVSAAGYAQKISLSKRSAPLIGVFNDIRNQSGYDFVFTTALLESAKPVSINVKNTELKEVLDKIFENQPLTYSIEDKTVVVSKKESSLLDRVIARFQETDVRGKVVDTLGNGLPGATVSVKNGKGSTSTDAGGNFQLRDVDEGAMLVVSYLGYVTKEVAVSKEFNYITLQQSASKLDEVQIQAYGVTSRRLSTGNISTVKADEISKSSLSNPLLAIQGRVPGIFVEQASGVPGGGVKVRIQGQNSMQKGNDPLYVIDGVPYASQLLPVLNGGDLGSSGPNSSGNPLNFINPNDIESIDVLKDADATSIYGSRAANGAILITTKKGFGKNAGVDIQLRRGVGDVANKLKMLNTDEYLLMRREAKRNDAAEMYPGPYGDVDLLVYDQSKYTDWQKVFLGGSSALTNIQTSISGGGQQTTFLISGNYNKETTVTPGDFYNTKGSFHINLNNKSANNKFTIGFSGNYQHDINKLGQVAGLASNAFLLPPNSPNLYNEDGSLNWALDSDAVPNLFNPLNALFQKNTNRTSNLVANTVLSYQLLQNLKIKGSFGYNNLESDEVLISPIAQLPYYIKAYTVRESSFNSAKIETWLIEPQITYNASIFSGRVEALVGTTLQQEKRGRQRVNAQGFNSDALLENIKAASNIFVDGAGDATIFSTYRYNAGFARLGYSYANKYLASFNLRRDGSSRFGDENKYHTFWSVSGAWVFTNESTLKANNSKLSFGKLKASYGTTGSDQIGDYRYLNIYNFVPGISTPYQDIISLQPQEGFPNPYLQWEETKKLSVTLDLGFFSDRVIFNGTYYHNLSSNQLLSLALPTISGNSSVPANVPAKIRNSGWEFLISSTNLYRGALRWSSSINLTIPSNKLLSYSGADVESYISQGLIGRPVGVGKYYRLIGVNSKTGLYEFADKNGTATSTPDPNQDRTVFISLDPKYFGGIQNTLSFGNLDLDFLIQFVAQKGQTNFYGSAPGFQGNQPRTVLNRWQKEGDNATIQKFSTSDAVADLVFKANSSDKAFTDASYIRLKNVSVSWTLPKNTVSKLGLRTTRFFIQGQNILTFTNYLGLDPESRTLNGIPPLRVVSLGFNVGL